MNKTLLPLIFLTSVLLSDDVYDVTYSKKDGCIVTKNGKVTELFDTRFKKKQPRSSYTCSAIQKENYNDCVRVEHKNTSAEFLGFGAYDYTNLIIAFKNPHPSVESSIKVRCTKKLK